MLRRRPCRKHLDDTAAGLTPGGFASSSRSAEPNTRSNSRQKSVTTGALEASDNCTPHSEFAFELVVQLRLPTTSSAVVSPTSSSCAAAVAARVGTASAELFPARPPHLLLPPLPLQNSITWRHRAASSSGVVERPSRFLRGRDPVSRRQRSH